MSSFNDATASGATLTDACLWETQRSGWSIQSIVCEAAYWDKNWQERTIYRPDEFERLYADTTKIVLHYEGGIRPIEIATLPALIQQIEAAHPGCVLRLHSVQEAPGGATVTLIVEDMGEASPANIVEQLQESARQLQAAQRYALEQTERGGALAREFSQFKERVAPLLLEHAEQQRRSVEERAHYLTVLFLDMRDFSRLGESERSTHIALLRGFAQPILEQGAAQHINTWGDAIVACFEDPTTGVVCACRLVAVLQAAGIQTRIGMGRGKTLVRYNQLTGRPDIEGDSVNVAARLEPMAQPGEVLITEELRYHPDVQHDRFVFTPQQHPLTKSVGDQPQGTLIECYTVKLAERASL